MESNSTACTDLSALIDALDTWKEEAQHVLSEQTANHTEDMQPSSDIPFSRGRKAIVRRRSERNTCANQGLRRSTRRIPTTSRDVSTLFVPEHDMGSDSGYVEPAVPIPTPCISNLYTENDNIAANDALIEHPGPSGLTEHPEPLPLLCTPGSNNDNGNRTSDEQTGQSLLTLEHGEQNLISDGGDNMENGHHEQTAMQSNEHYESLNHSRQRSTELDPLFTAGSGYLAINDYDMANDSEPGLFSNAFGAGYGEQRNSSGNLLCTTEQSHAEIDKDDDGNMITRNETNYFNDAFEAGHGQESPQREQSIENMNGIEHMPGGNHQSNGQHEAVAGIDDDHNMSIENATNDFNDAFEAGYGQESPQREQSIENMDGIEHMLGGNFQADGQYEAVAGINDGGGVGIENAANYFNDTFEAGHGQESPQREQSIENMDGIEHMPGGNHQTNGQHEAVTHRVIRSTDSPQYSNEAFAGLFSVTPHPAPGVSEPQSFAEDAVFKEYLELACRSTFRLPHESIHDPDHSDVLELLLPLVEEIPLTTELIHGLLYSLIPGTLQIEEVFSNDIYDGLSSIDDQAKQFAAIIHRCEESRLLLVLGDSTMETLFILEGKTAGQPTMEAFPPLFSKWKTKYIDVSLSMFNSLLHADLAQPDSIGPHIEPTLLAVFIADACFRRRLPIKIDDVPSSRDLRLQFLEELLAPYERGAVLAKCGIPNNSTPSQNVDIREIVLQPTTQLHAVDEGSLPDLENFDMAALHAAFIRKPAEVSPVRCFRILQCVNEIGSPNILGSLRLALTKRPDDRTAHTVDQPIVDKLFHIHIYLDTQESRSHLLIARNRYIKFCYFETYQVAVKALRDEKRNSNLEHRRVAARKGTASYKQGLREELPPTPHSDNIRHRYKNLTDSEKKRRAPDMVKDEITRKVLSGFGGDEKRTRRNINRYIREGKVLHQILQGTVRLNPGMLILFPGRETHPPSLDLEQFSPDIQSTEQKSLESPIDIREYVSRMLLANLY
jgi:hypothetical protein